MGLVLGHEITGEVIEKGRDVEFIAVMTWCRSRSTSPTSFATGQCPVMRCNRELMTAILHDRVQIATNVNATVIR